MNFKLRAHYNLENPETLPIKIRLSLTTKWIDNQKVSWSIKTGKPSHRYRIFQPAHLIMYMMQMETWLPISIKMYRV